jgi:hypothetical protein
MHGSWGGLTRPECTRGARGWPHFRGYLRRLIGASPSGGSAPNVDPPSSVVWGPRSARVGLRMRLGSEAGSLVRLDPSACLRGLRLASERSSFAPLEIQPHLPQGEARFRRSGPRPVRDQRTSRSGRASSPTDRASPRWRSRRISLTAKLDFEGVTLIRLRSRHLSPGTSFVSERSSFAPLEIQAHLPHSEARFRRSDAHPVEIKAPLPRDEPRLRPIELRRVGDTGASPSQRSSISKEWRSSG